MKFFSPLLLLVISFTLSLSCISDDKPQESANAVQVGHQLPDFEVRLNDGTAVSKENLKGRVALITFFNTGCGDCKRFLPVLNAVYQEIRTTENHPLRSVVFLPISRAQVSESVSAYWTEHGFSLPYAAQPDRHIYDRFATSGIPRNYVVNAEGRVTAVFDDQNPPTAEQLKTALQQALVR